MGLFYVWLKFCAPDNVNQRLIAFVNREAADEWWRLISTPPSVHAGRVKRLSPHYYVQNDGKNVWFSFDDGKLPNTRDFFERMFSVCIISGAGDIRASIMPPTEITDHISGRWYFVRSKADPLSHWYLRTSGICAVCSDANCDAIHVSSDYRTRFCVRVRNLPAIPEDFVMIGKDEISIAAPRGYVLYIDDAGDLKATKEYQGKTDLLFGDLNNRFVTRAEKQVNGEVWEYVESVERDVGEPWKLV